MASRTPGGAISVGEDSIVLDLQSEWHQVGQPHHDLYEAVTALKRRHDLHPCSVQANDSLSLRNDHDREAVQDLVAQYRKLSEDTRQRLPALLNSLAQLQLVIGDLEQGQADFQEVTRLVDDPIAQAEAQHNVYRAALERQQYDEALAALCQAVALDADSFEPFPFALYPPLRILTAGAFGTRFICQHGSGTVVVTALRPESLDRDLYSVFRDCRLVMDLDHGAVARLHATGFAGPEPQRPYLVADYLADYEPLDLFIAREGPLSPEVALEVAWPLARALQALHHRGVLHRCLRPSAVLVRREKNKTLTVKLLDVGLSLKRAWIHAVASHPDAQLLTSLGRTVARLKGYLPPELTGRPKGNVWLGPHSDFYSFGRLCAFLLTGKPDPDTADQLLLPENWSTLLNLCTGWTIHRRPAHAGPILDLLTASQGADDQVRQLDKRMHDQTLEEIEKQLATAPQSVAALVARSTVYARQGELAKALADLTHAIEQTPEDVSLWCRRALVHARADNQSEVVADYTQALQREPRHLEALIGRAEAYSRLREWNAAIADYTEAIRQSPKDESLYFGRGNAFYSLGQYARAVADYAEVIRLSPSHLWAVGNRGRAYLSMGEPGRALTDFNRLLALDPHNIRGLLDRALTFLELKRLDHAIADFTTAISIEPSAGLYQERAKAHARNGNYEQALADYTEALQRVPESVSLLVGRARNYSRLDRLNEALADLDKAVELNPEDAALRQQRSEILLRLGQVDAALADLDEGIRLNPEDPTLRFYRGNLLSDRGELDRAIADYSVAIREDDEASGAYTNRANAHARLGEYEAALADYARALELDPEDALAYANRAAVYTRMDRLDEALADYTEVLRLTPEDARAHSNRGVLLAQRGEWERALADLDRALELQPQAARVWMHRGKVHRNLQDTQKALADFSRALELDASLVSARYERALLQDDPQAALADYNALLQHEPNHLGARLNRAVLLAEAGQIEAALQDLEVVLEHEPSQPLARFHRARLRISQGQWQAARDDLDAVLANDPTDVDALILRGQVRLHLGDSHGAKADNETAAAFAPEDPRIANNLAWLAVLSGDDPQTALASAQRAFNAQDNLASRDTLAAALALVGRFDEALALLEPVVQQSNNHHLAARLDAYRVGRSWSWQDEQRLG
ncbi:MAG: tetratricopeptide repeat protein [Gemmataceae bacterium]